MLSFTKKIIYMFGIYGIMFSSPAQPSSEQMDQMLLDAFQIILSLIIISIILPYFFVGIWGYPPRYSIHLIPFSLLLIFKFVSNKKIFNV